MANGGTEGVDLLVDMVERGHAGPEEAELRAVRLDVGAVAFAVAFDLSLVRPADGAILWRGNYDKTQKSLFENLFDWNTSVKSKGLWLTAKKLAAFGLEKLLAEMPGTPAGKQGKDTACADYPGH